MPVRTTDITWRVERAASQQIRDLPDEVQAEYPALVNLVREMVCDFINAREHCDGKTHGVACLGGISGGGKVLKVRGRVPNRGASRSLRLEIAVYCATREATVLSAEWRRDK